MTKAKDIINELERIFPNELNAEWDTTDGLIKGDTNKDIKKVILSLELRENLIDKDADMIILHHPPLFGYERKVTNPFFDKLKSKDIIIYTNHSRMDKSGFINEALAEKIFKSENYKITKILEDGTAIIELNHPLNIEEIVSIIKDEFYLKHLNVIVKKNFIKKVAIHGGEGFNQHHILNADKEKIDLYIGGDMTHHLAEHAHFFNACFVDIGHFSEQEGMRKLNRMLKEAFNNVEFNYIEQNSWWTSK